MKRVIVVALPWVVALGFFLAWRDVRGWMLTYKSMNEGSQETVGWIASQRDACQSQLKDQAQRAAVAALFLQQVDRGRQTLDREQQERETSERLDSLERRLNCEQRNRQFFDEQTVSALCR